MDTDFLEAVKANDLSTVAQMLDIDSTLAGRNFAPKSLHTNGFPIYHASKQGNLDLVEILLSRGADPDAKLANVDEPREFGMPLIHALDNERLDIVNLLLDHDPGLNAFPYCSTPFVDRIYNAMRDHPEFDDDVGFLIERSFSPYFESADDLSLIHI